MEKDVYELEWSRAQDIALSMDLVKAAKQQLQFLAAVDSIDCLYDGPVLDRAIYRYKNCWLPLLAKHGESTDMTEPLVVPLDCEWIWHCHRLNPEQYKVDCEHIYGRILGYQNVSSSIKGTSTEETERVWNHMYPSEPYYFKQRSHSLPSTNCANAGLERNIEYDLVAAVKRQRSFFQRVSESLRTADHYLKEAVARYKAFLHLIKRNEERSVKCFIVPTYDIDLIWHAHQLNPLSYCNDLVATFGDLIGHSDRIPDNKQCVWLQQTCKLWEDTYGRDYLTIGSLFKGDDKVGSCLCTCGWLDN